MYKGRELKGMSVFALDEQKKIAQVEDIVVDRSTGKFLGFLVSNLGIWKTNKFLPAEAIAVLSPQGVTINHKSILQRNNKNLNAVMQNGWLGAKVFDTQGSDFGTVADIVLDYPRGNLTGLEISAGLVNDLSDGRSFLPWQEIRLSNDQGFVTNISRNESLS